MAAEKCAYYILLLTLLLTYYAKLLTIEPESGSYRSSRTSRSRVIWEQYSLIIELQQNINISCI